MKTGGWEIKTLSEQLGKIESIVDSGSSLAELLESLDRFNQSAVMPLSKTYGSQRLAKLLLLKLSNIVVGKFQYRHRHAHLIAQPFGLIVDPCNTCPLACPGCIHRKTELPQANIDWVPGNLKQNTVDQLFGKYGPYAISTQYFNWGEPLLNKKTPDFIRTARRFLTRTSISTNLSVPFDAEALVASGLDYLVMSIDGASANTYQKYRVDGDWELVLKNVTKLVEARNRLKSKTPYLVWQYLLFEHTLGEIDQAKQMAKQLGVDRINFSIPYDVSKYDPTISVPETPPVQYEVFNVQAGAQQQSAQNAMRDLHPIIDEHWERTWKSRYTGEMQSQEERSTCRWLYQDMVMDATGRILPCCFDPTKTPVSVFGSIDSDAFNTEKYIASRKYFAESKSPAPETVCPSCQYAHTNPNINTNHLAPYFQYSNLQTSFDIKILSALFNWDT